MHRNAGWGGLVYHRLHGSPHTYYSSYSDDFLALLAGRVREAARASAIWCIFDNTAAGAAIPNALRLIQLARG